MLLNRALLFIVAMGTGYLLSRLHLPIPYMMGGMLVALSCKTFGRKLKLSWPKLWREYSLYIAGYGIGSNFSDDAWHNMLYQSVGVIEANASIMLASFVLAYIAYKLTHEDLLSCTIGMLPGGMTLSMLLAEEDNRVNPNIVVVMQVLRLLGVVISVPFMAIYLLGAQVQNAGINLPDRGGMIWLIMIPLAELGYRLAKLLHLPTQRLLGPIITTALFSVLVSRVQPVPGPLMAAAQVSIGLYMGMQLDADKIVQAKKCVPCVIIGTAGMVGVSAIMANVLSARYGFDLITAFLAMAPGGAAEMCLAGLSMGSDVAIILTYQIVRVFAINLFIPPFISFMFKKVE